MPCKVLPSKRAAYVAYNGNEVSVTGYEVLTGNGFTWIGSSNGHTPTGAVLVGNQRNGEPLYMGRANFQGSVTPGKVHQSHGCLYIPYAGAEHKILHYEVLVGTQQGIDFIVHSLCEIKFKSSLYNFSGLGNCKYFRSATWGRTNWRKRRGWIAVIHWACFARG